MTPHSLPRRWLPLLAALFAAFLVEAAGGTRHPTVLVVGDSLSSAYGIPRDKGWVSLLQERITSAGYPHVVVNVSVAGQTTDDALRTLPDSLREHEPQLVIIELGARDAFADKPLDELQANLQRMVRMSREVGADVALFEMLVPPERKPMPYPTLFREKYHEVARTERATLVPFFMRSIVGRPEAFQRDRVHPSASAQPELLDAAWPVISRMLEEDARQVSRRGAS